MVKAFFNRKRYNKPKCLVFTGNCGKVMGNNTAVYQVI